MKAFIIALITALLVILAVVLNSVFLDISLSVLIDECEAIPEAPEEIERWEALYESFCRWQRFIALTVSHEDMSNIESDFAEILASARIGDKDTLIIAKSRLVMTLTHLRRLSGVNPDSIL
ncbi:MAG: hypothetical protein J6L90_04390 [Clostridia bacterium]|nr:hypothetical protein [Clostridia bacterium]